MGPVTGPYIDGRITPSRSDAALDVVNPSTGQPLPAIPAGCAADVDAAVDCARAAFERGAWSDQPPSFRRQSLLRWAELIAAEAAELDALDAAEMGKPVSEPTFSAAGAAALVRYYAEALDKIAGDVYTSDKQSFAAQRHVPRGVVGAVVPWNFPAFNAALKVAPALAAGNCVVLKPSELASRSAMRMASLAVEAGVPPGVFNVVPGRGEVVGRALGLHDDVDMIAFTGSTDVGKLMLQYAGQSNMKVVLAECGGKSPQIVFDDGIDVEAAADFIARMVLINQGQICSLGSRLLVQNAIAPLVLKTIAARMRQVVIGDALDASTTFGPIASAAQLARVMGFLESAAREGAERVSGGQRARPESAGYFIEPTVFTNVSPVSRIAQQEIFGPVLCVIPFADEAEAVRIANGTIYGLAAYVWTQNLSRGMRMARQIRSSVLVNANVPLGEGPGFASSLEPARQSGVGIEGGLRGLESYLRRQLVWFNHG